MTIEAEVLKRIRPSPEERELVLSFFHNLRKHIEEFLRSQGIKAEVSLQGSVAKDTWLSGDRDIDVFVIFDEPFDKEWIKDFFIPKLLEHLRAHYTVDIRYAEHPYLHITGEGLEADVVPAVRIKPGEKPFTAADRTPLHTEYIKNKLSSNQHDEVRLLKAFMKGVGVYGAEIKVRGFSGYLAELLVLAYGTFRKVIEEASKWKPPIVIDIEGHWKDRRALLRRFRSPLIVVDPVDPQRNVAAAVSLNKLAVFVTACKAYITRPSLKFFFSETSLITEHDVPSIEQKRALRFIVLEASAELPPDVIWGEALRVERAFVKLLEQWGFKVVDSRAWTDEKRIAVIGLELESLKLSDLEEWVGPPAFGPTDNVVKFIDTHRFDPAGPWVKGDRLVVLRPRRYKHVDDLLRCRGREALTAPHFRSSEVKVLSLKDLMDLAKAMNDKGSLLTWLTGFVRKKLPWLE